ncbi:MAG TPA: FAD-dependent oxidoreductase, partial [Acidobacteriota bacterium]|nr:FAD-dependent oxidoreductase [Acidobacteriota bacterium]
MEQKGQIVESEAVVVGAGAFGGWTALLLQEAGVRTLLVDAWGAGNQLSSSGGETRVLRAGYGELPLYSEMALKARRLWKEREAQWGLDLLHERPILWIGTGDEPLLRDSLRTYQDLDVPHRRLSAAQVEGRFPDFRCRPPLSGLLELSAGVLFARKACRAVAQAFQQAGGRLIRGRARPPLTGEPLTQLELEDGRILKAERFLFACGPWMAALFDRDLEDRLEVTRQEVYFFSPPAAHPALEENGGPSCRLPIFYDASSQGAHYGIPPLHGRGVKIASDISGPAIDPDRDPRRPSAQSLRGVREFLAQRLPFLARAPLLESRVCQYTRTADRHFLLGPHPRIHNLFLLGAGSGHGFKHGPVV